MSTNPVTIQLDRVRTIRWTLRAQARNASLKRPVSFASLGRRRNSLYALCALLWSALVEKDHEFEDPEDIAEFLSTDEQQLAALRAVAAMVEEAFPSKKNGTSPDSSTNGPERSSISASPSITGA